jgi:CPA2 family monovalent cation:H+ antiporter-2
MGFRVYYGDATRSDLLESAGAEDARILVIAIDGPGIVAQLVETVQKRFPHLELMVRARNRFDAYELIDAGVRNIYREHLDTSVRVGVDVLKMLGHRSYTATRAAQDFLKYDEAALRSLAPTRHDMQQYISSVRAEIQSQEELLRSDLQHDPTVNDHAWDSEEIRETVIRGSFSRE